MNLKDTVQELNIQLEEAFNDWFNMNIKGEMISLCKAIKTYPYNVKMSEIDFSMGGVTLDGTLDFVLFEEDSDTIETHFFRNVMEYRHVVEMIPELKILNDIIKMLYEIKFYQYATLPAIDLTNI